jgi:D-arabinose 1-dehydrogenase-like Zn-dependent alcohol dehydrogenase
MTSMRAVEVPRAGGGLRLTEREIPAPGPGEVRVRVEACGICHSDLFVTEGHWPGIQYPRVPGHEIAGRVDAVGEGVTTWAKGDKVGVGWYGGHCGVCPSCRRGDFILCAQGRVCGISYDGGYADYMIAPAQALARVPDGLAPADVAPLLCAGITTFNALRNSGALAGDLVAVQGLGGLGHLGIQFANRLGFRTVAVSRGSDKRELATKLGAHEYLDTDKVDAAEELQRLGGARVILATAPNSKATSQVAGGLGANGTLLLVGVEASPLEISPFLLVGKRARVQGWSSGVAADSEDTLRFSALTGVRPMVETFPLERAAEALARMHENKVRFRSVLVTGAG